MIEKKNQPTKNQLETLAVMVKGKWYSAYDLQVRISTLESLNKKGLVQRKSDLGAIFSPATGIKFRKIV